MSYRVSGSNNDVGTHDHEYDAGRYGRKSGIRLRVESSKHGSARYYLTDTKHDKPGQCCGEVRIDDWSNTRCSYNGKLEYRGRNFCKIHYPPSIFEKAQARHDKFDREWNERQARNRMQERQQDWRDRALEALREIAKGELNDPAGYAAMILEEEPK